MPAKVRTTAKLTVTDTNAPSSETSVPKFLPYIARRHDEYGAWNAKQLARGDKGDECQDSPKPFPSE